MLWGVTLPSLFGSLHKRRDRTIQRVGDGAEPFSFVSLDQAVCTDDLHAGFNPIPFDLRRGQREAIERGIEAFQPAFCARQQLQPVGLRRQMGRARPECPFDFAGVASADVCQCGSRSKPPAPLCSSWLCLDAQNSAMS